MGVMSRWFMVLVVLFVSAQSLDAQNMRLKFFSNQVDADRNQSYPLTQKQGPYLILCASFSGENGLRQANDLVYELRSQHRIEAYIYRKQFDYSGKIKGIGYSSTQKQIDNQGQTRPAEIKMKAANGTRIEEVAVVVGDFPTMDDKATQQMLKKIKYLKPRTLEVSNAIDTNQSLGHVRENFRQFSNIKELRQMGPMRQAMVIANPLLPEEYFTRNTVDQTIIKLNKDLTYTLLKNPKAYSVRVATFRGESTLGKGVETRVRTNQFSFTGNRQRNQKSKLAIASAKAHRLTNELRKAGVEAYEFHDRHESYVCVGGFDWVKKPRRDGKDELNVNVARIIQSYKATVVNFGEHKGLIQPRSLPKLRHLGIVFDVQPVPVAVPKMR